MRLVINLFNNNRDKYKLKDVVFFCHGWHSQILLNYKSKDQFNLNNANLLEINANIFFKDGVLYSDACRTGISVDGGDFDSLSEAKPDGSLAQEMANRFDITVKAFYVRSFYRDVIRKKDKIVKLTFDNKKYGPQSSNVSMSRAIQLSLVKARKLNPSTNILSLRPPFQALRDSDLVQTGNAFKGGIGEGTNGYALWRIGGGRALPVGHHTPTGLPRGFITFTKKVELGRGNTK